MRLNDGLDSSRQLTSSFLSLLSMLKRNSEHFLRKQSACLCETLHPENAFHGQRDSWHERLDETICEGGVRPYCWFSSVSSPFPGPVVPTHLLCKFNLDCERPAEGSSGLLWVSQSAARCRHAGLGGGLGGWFGSSVFACQKCSMCSLTRPKMPYTPWMWPEGSTQVAVLSQLQEAC